MTGPERPVRQPANTRASVLLTCIVNLQGRFQLLRHDPVGGSSGVGSGYTAPAGNWASASRPVREVGGVYTGRRCDVVPESKERRMVAGDLLSRARAGD